MRVSTYPASKTLIPVLANAEVLEQMWLVDPVNYVKTYPYPPCCRWFGFERATPCSFYVADCRINLLNGIEILSFSNGRHRTRWLLQNSVQYLPIGLREGSIERGKELGLVIKRLDADAEINICWSPAYIDFSRELNC